MFQQKVTQVARNFLDSYRKHLTDFHLLRFGVDKTTKIKVGEVVAYNIDICVSAVRAKPDSRYMQRPFSSFSFAGLLAARSPQQQLKQQFIKHCLQFSGAGNDPGGLMSMPVGVANRNSTTQRDQRQ